MHLLPACEIHRMAIREVIEVSTAWWWHVSSSLSVHQRLKIVGTKSRDKEIRGKGKIKYPKFSLKKGIKESRGEVLKGVSGSIIFTRRILVYGGD